VSQNDFESNLYQFPICDLFLHVNDDKGLILTNQIDSSVLTNLVKEGISKLIESSNWYKNYISSKVVIGEPLHSALLQNGFRAIEYRRLYTCKISELRATEFEVQKKGICYTTLSAIPTSDHEAYREQVLAIAQESFAQGGYSRHFTDSFLLNRCAGVEYIKEVMKLNFKSLDPKKFLLAIDNDLSVVCGFSVIGKKPGIEETTYTQLLSAVSKEYRGLGIYRGITRLLSESLPPDARLLNVTHVENQKIQRAYEGSGRKHMADTVVIRRIFHTT
jgi:ribosomal protein S18 acetylase RimI-like enzyme